MTELFPVGIGAVNSADIAVPDHERELRFYSRVLSTGERPLWREDLMSNLGLPVIGLGARTEAYDKLPLQWMPHIQVEDVGSSVERALEMGGEALMHGRDSSGNSQWAVVRDPNGACFGVVPITPAEAIPAVELDGPVGRITWLDLTVPNADSTRDFYRNVIGWSVAEVEMKNGDDRYADYNMLRQDSQPGAGICHARGANAGLPPVWMIYLPVGNLEESLRRVESEGGKVLNAVRMADGQYAYAAIQDPLGVYFALMPG